MKLPAALAKLVGKIVVVGGKQKLDGEPLAEPGATGLVFDGSKLVGSQRRAVMDLFGDSDPETDFEDLLDDGKLKPEWLPFMLWRPDGLDERHDLQVKNQDKSATTKTVAFARDGAYPQFISMWFVHKTGRVVAVQVDGTFLPAPKADALVSDYKALKLRVATYADLGREDEEAS